MFYTDAPYQDKDTNICFMGVDATSLAVKERHSYPGGSYNFQIFAFEPYFYGYFEKNKILCINTSSCNLTVFNLTTNKLEDLKLGAKGLYNINVSNNGEWACGMGENEAELYIWNLPQRTRKVIDLKSYYDKVWSFSEPSLGSKLSSDGKRLVLHLFFAYETSHSCSSPL